MCGIYGKKNTFTVVVYSIQMCVGKEFISWKYVLLLWGCALSWNWIGFINPESFAWNFCTFYNVVSYIDIFLLIRSFYQQQTMHKKWTVTVFICVWHGTPLQTSLKNSKSLHFYCFHVLFTLIHFLYRPTTIANQTLVNITKPIYRMRSYVSQCDIHRE